MFSAFLLACAAGTPLPDDSAPDGGAPAYCAEDHRVSGVDPSVAAEGLGFAADEARAAQVGAFAGVLAPYADDGPAPALTLALDAGDGGVDAVYFVLVGGGVGGDEAQGAPEVADCPPGYAYTLVGTLGSDPLLYGGTFAAEMLVVDPAAGVVSAGIPLEENTGDGVPTFDTSAWDGVELRVDATAQDGAWVGSLGWSAWNEGARAPLGSGGTETGVIAPSGMTEGIGSFGLARVTEP